MNTFRDEEIPKTRAKARIGFYLVGLSLLMYVGFKLYNVYLQPVKITFKDGYTGVTRFVYEPSAFQVLYWNQKTFEVYGPETVVRSENPFEQFCEIQGFQETNGNLVKCETEYDLTISSNRPRLFVVDLNDDLGESEFVLGHSVSDQ